MSETIDARGLPCPQPVVLTKKALEQHDDIIVKVDNQTAAGNVTRAARKSGCTVDAIKGEDGTIELRIAKGGSVPSAGASAGCCTDTEGGTTPGPTVFVFSSNAMGSGSEELGILLMKAFIHTVTELDALPDIMIFYNTGVKLAVKDSDVIEDLKGLEAKGVQILVCGTCAKFFAIADAIGIGTISNMYDIANTLSSAGRIVRP